MVVTDGYNLAVKKYLALFLRCPASYKEYHAHGLMLKDMMFVSVLLPAGLLPAGMAQQGLCEARGSLL